MEKGGWRREKDEISWDRAARKGERRERDDRRERETERERERENEGHEERGERDRWVLGREQEWKRALIQLKAKGLCASCLCA